MLGIRDMSQAFMFADGVRPHFQHVIRQEIKMKPKSPKLAANQNAIYLNSKLFKRIETLYNQRNNLKFDAESIRLVERTYQRID